MCDFKIASVVVTYNRKELLKKNINSILEQTIPTDIIIIDNNSNDGTSELFENEYSKEKDKIHYYKLKENIGGAGGFSKGVDIAYKLGYDLIWLMDDDGRPYDDLTLENLLKVVNTIKNNYKEFILNSLVLFDDNELSFGLLTSNDTKESIQNLAYKNIIQDKINPFNGTLISKELIEKIGLPNKDFFIKGDEIDYCNRARRIGAYIATITNSLYFHPKMPRKYKYIFGKKFLIRTEAPWKDYYRVRNYTYMIKRDYNFLHALKFFIANLINAFLSDNNKILSLKMMTLGFKDGITGKLGNKIKP